MRLQFYEAVYQVMNPGVARQATFADGRLRSQDKISTPESLLQACVFLLYNPIAVNTVRLCLSPTRTRLPLVTQFVAISTNEFGIPVARDNELWSFGCYRRGDL